MSNDKKDIPQSVILDLDGSKANPDCDFQEKRSLRGCPAQATHVMYVRTKDGLYQDNKFYGCRAHAPLIWANMILPLAKAFHKTHPEDKTTPVLHDLKLLREYLEQEKRKIIPLRNYILRH